MGDHEVRKPKQARLELFPDKSGIVFFALAVKRKRFAKYQQKQGSKTETFRHKKTTFTL